MSTTTNKQLSFETSLNWLSADRGILHAHHVNGPIYVAAPEQFGGTGKEWSPEHLLLGAVASCFMSTFITFAKKQGLEFRHFECRASGQVEIVQGKYKFSAIHVISVTYIHSETIREKAMAVIGKTQAYCLISNSINAAITYDSQVLLAAHLVPAN